MPPLRTLSIFFSSSDFSFSPPVEEDEEDPETELAGAVFASPLVPVALGLALALALVMVVADVGLELPLALARSKDQELVLLFSAVGDVPLPGSD